MRYLRPNVTESKSVCDRTGWRVETFYRRTDEKYTEKNKKNSQRRAIITALTGSSCLRFLPGRPTLRLLWGLAGVASSALSWSAPSSLWGHIEDRECSEPLTEIVNDGSSATAAQLQSEWWRTLGKTAVSDRSWSLHWSKLATPEEHNHFIQGGGL